MSLSNDTIEHLIDLVEIKLGAFTVYGIEDHEELRQLETARSELLEMRDRRAAVDGPADIIRLSAYR